VPDTKTGVRIATAILVTVGLIAGGYAIGSGVRGFRTADRYVSVKGIAEKEVKADLALWPLRVTAAPPPLVSVARVVAPVALFVTREVVAH